jgi:hypothetical protein
MHANTKPLITDCALRGFSEEGYPALIWSKKKNRRRTQYKNPSSSIKPPITDEKRRAGPRKNRRHTKYKKPFIKHKTPYNE